MKEMYKRVVDFDWVSSKDKTKIISSAFLLAVSLLAAYFLNQPKSSVASDITVQNIISLTNQSRIQSGKILLVENAKLSRAAEMKAIDMVANNYFSHTSPSGVTPWKWIEKEKYDYDYAGENLAMDFHSAEKMESAWMESPTHRANIINEKYREVGVAVREGKLNGRNTIVVVVMFGSGDKNIETENFPNLKVLESSQSNRAGKIPTLPGEEKKKFFVQEYPLITSPQPGETFSQDEIDIAGWASPGKEVFIFDNGNFVATVMAEADGRFSKGEIKFSEGSHSVYARSRNIASIAETKFFIDQEKPIVNFRLYANMNDSRQYFLETSTNKNRCTFQVNGEKRIVSQGKKTIFAIGSEKSSVILKIADHAGNKNFKQISLANFYSPEERSDISKKIISFFSQNKNIFAAESGREAFLNNLNLPIPKFAGLR